MNDHPNAIAVLRSFAAFNSGDMDALRENFTEDIVLRFAGNNAMSGTYRGRDAVMDALGRAIQGWGPHAEMEAILASDDHVMAFFHATGEQDGKTMDLRLAMPIKLNADAKLTDIWFLANDQRAYDQFWS
jgi:ketosteroid isomerase-like protein